MIGFREGKVPIKEISERTRMTKSCHSTTRHRLSLPTRFPPTNPVLVWIEKSQECSYEKSSYYCQTIETNVSRSKNVTERTIQHHLHKSLDMPCRTAARKLSLTDKMKMKKLELANTNRDWTFGDWKHLPSDVITSCQGPILVNDSGFTV